MNSYGYGYSNGGRYTSDAGVYAKLFAGLLVAALLIGMALTGSEIFKPFTGHRTVVETELMQKQALQKIEAQAQVDKAQAEAEAKRATLMGESDQQVIRAQTQARLAIVEAEKRAKIATLEDERRIKEMEETQRLETNAKLVNMGLIITAMAGCGISIALTIALIRAARLIPSHRRPQTIIMATPPLDYPASSQLTDRATELEELRRQRKLAQAREVENRSRNSARAHLLSAAPALDMTDIRCHK